jgi:predicted transcriptional regulator
MRRLFSGYSVQTTKGWYRDPETGKEVRDRHFRIDVDLLVTRSVTDSLRKWKNILELRFDQTAIYMRLSERAFLL